MRDHRTPKASSPEALRRMRNTRRRDTPKELALRSALHRRGYRFLVDRAPINGLRRRADLVFPRARVAVFVDGCFWHGCPVHGTSPKINGEWWRDKLDGNRRRDRDTDETLRNAGWTVVRIWEHEATDAAATRVAATLDQRSR